MSKSKDIQGTPFEELRSLFSEKGIKTTPQRITVYQALMKLRHPCVDEIAEEVHKTSPTITIATIYNILEFFCEKNIIAKMMTNSGKMHYETNNEPHHHIYDTTNDIIKDYQDEKLSELIQSYLKNKDITNWEITDFQLHLHGKYKGEI